jgi:hypothetical protein
VKHEALTDAQLRGYPKPLSYEDLCRAYVALREHHVEETESLIRANQILRDSLAAIRQLIPGLPPFADLREAVKTVVEGYQRYVGLLK